jgi:hypothetical protein
MLSPEERGFMDNTEIMSEQEAAAYLRVTTSGLRKWRVRRIGPPFVRFGRRLIRYRKADIINWIEQNAARELGDGQRDQMEARSKRQG